MRHIPGNWGPVPGNIGLESFASALSFPTFGVTGRPILLLDCHKRPNLLTWLWPYRMVMDDTRCGHCSCPACNNWKYFYFYSFFIPLPARTLASSVQPDLFLCHPALLRLRCSESYSSACSLLRLRCSQSYQPTTRIHRDTNHIHYFSSANILNLDMSHIFKIRHRTAGTLM